jgi:hypothetical protein
MSNLPARRSQQVAAFLDKQAKQVAHAARLIFALDATASRQPTWDSACHLQAQMFAEAAKLGSLQVQLVYYRDITECRSSPWTYRHPLPGGLLLLLAEPVCCPDAL